MVQKEPTSAEAHIATIAGSFERELHKLKVAEGKAANLRKRATAYRGKLFTKDTASGLLDLSVERLSALQDKLYAHNQYGMLICLQAMDAAGKDGAVKHILSGLNPQGVRVTSFKQPSSEELDHDFLWRHYRALPARGEIGIFNRSHYENVLISRVHPEIVLGENLPSINSIADITKEFWAERLHMIRQFENIVVGSGTLVVKFFLHVSKEEQCKRLISRIDDPTKNWKFSLGDVQERAYWDDYLDAYEEAISATSTADSPWYVIPADDKWYARVAMATIIHSHMDSLNLSYPTLSPQQKSALRKARKELLR